MNLDKQQKLKISAVIALYNGSTHIIEALESVSNQTLPVNEIIIIDDGSSDDSVSLINSYLSKNKSLKAKTQVISQKNQGQGVARNRGVFESSGHFIGFLDQDDTWEPQHCEILSQFFMRNPTIGWVFTDFNEFDENGRVIRRNFLAENKYSLPEKSIFGLISQDLMMLPSSSLIRREAYIGIGGFDAQFRGYEDDDLFFRLFVAGWDFQFCEESLVNYRIHPENSSRQITFPKSRMKFYRKYKIFFDKSETYYGAFYHNSLVPRILGAVKQDAYKAVDQGLNENFHFAKESISEIYLDAGGGLRTRITNFIFKRKFLLLLVIKFRFLIPNFPKDKD